jgi:hypothetical protein
MKDKDDFKKLSVKKSDNEENSNKGYPPYPDDEDIYNKNIEERDLNPEDISMTKAPNEKARRNNEKDFNEDSSGDDLDIPGLELEDIKANSGIEDEENDYYSLGGDDHNDLDEDNG